MKRFTACPVRDKPLVDKHQATMGRKAKRAATFLELPHSFAEQGVHVPFLLLDRAFLDLPRPVVSLPALLRLDLFQRRKGLCVFGVGHGLRQPKPRSDHGKAFLLRAFLFLFVIRRSSEVPQPRLRSTTVAMLGQRWGSLQSFDDCIPINQYVING